jgi:hypothetical protein
VVERDGHVATARFVEEDRDAHEAGNTGPILSTAAMLRATLERVTAVLPLCCSALHDHRMAAQS